jgi:hypothetical protein
MKAFLKECRAVSGLPEKHFDVLDSIYGFLFSIITQDNVNEI